MSVGPPASGKSSVWRILLEAMEVTSGRNLEVISSIRRRYVYTYIHAHMHTCKYTYSIPNRYTQYSHVCIATLLAIHTCIRDI